MKVFDKLNNNNFNLYAAKHYNNPQCTSVEEFQDDLSRFKYIKRLLGRYEKSGELAERLILNHLIVIHNVFGIEAARQMLLFKIDENHLPSLKPFLVFLSYLPDNELVEVPLDQYVVDKLRSI